MQFTGIATDGNRDRRAPSAQRGGDDLTNQGAPGARVESPLAIDLFCGLGGWAEGFLSEGYEVIGFDIERRPYPGQLVLQDVLTLHGSQFRDAAVIVASPPCQEYSYRAMPWKRAKALPPPSNELFEACFRIQREACEAAGRYIPMVVENVKGAQKWVGRAKWHFGSYYLWGDVPAIMPFARGGTKVPGLNWSGSDKPGYKARAFNTTVEAAIKNEGGSWFNIAHDTTSGLGNNPDGRHDGIKQTGSGPIWFDTGIAHLPSGSSRRKAASALIAKIPFSLAQHIARVYKPDHDCRRSECCGYTRGAP